MRIGADDGRLLEIGGPVWSLRLASKVDKNDHARFAFKKDRVGMRLSSWVMGGAARDHRVERFVDSSFPVPNDINASGGPGGMHTARSA